MAAERAAELSREGRPRRPDALDGRRAWPPRSRWTRPPTRADNAAAMEEALRHVRTGGVTEAARDDTQGRFRRGDSVGFIDEELVAWGEPGETLEVVLGELGREAELLTVIEGDGAPLRGDAVAALAPAERRGRALPRRPAGVVVARLGRVAAAPRTTIPGVAPTEFASSRSAARRGAAPPALPAPVALSRRWSSPARRRRRRRERLGLHTVGDLLEHVPRDRRAARTIGHAGDRARSRRSSSRSARSQPPGAAAGDAAARRGRRRRRKRHDEGDVLQPAVARARYRPGTRLLLTGKYQGRNAASASSSTR